MGNVFSSLKNFYFSLEDGYYDFMDSLDAKGVPVYKYFVAPLEKHGIPSFIVFMLLILLLLALALAVINAFYTASQADSLVVAVYGNKGASIEPLEGAAVEVYDVGSMALLENSTTKRGRVEFANYSRKNLLIKASAAGFASAEKRVDTTESKSVKIELACIGSACEAVATPSPGGSFRPTPTPSGPISFNNTDGDCDTSSSVGSLSLSVKFSNSKPAEGLVRLYNNASKALIDEVTLTRGKSQVEGLRVGTRVYGIVEEKGGLVYDGSENVVRIAPCSNQLALTITTTGANGSAGAGSNYSFITVTNGSVAIAGASVSVYKTGLPTALLTRQTNSQGQVSFNLTQGRYYAVAEKTGYYTNNSGTFLAGENASIVIMPESADNSTALNVTVLSASGQAVDGASVSVLGTANGQDFYVMQSGYTVSGATRFTGLQRGKTVKVIAENEGASGTTTVTLSSSEVNTSVTLSPIMITVAAYAVEPVTQSSVASPSFAAFFQNVSQNTSTSCSGNACNLSVPVGLRVLVSASAAGYVPANDSFVFRETDRSVTLYLASESLANTSVIQFLRFTDSSGREIHSNEWLTPGRQYTALLQVTSRNASRTGVFFTPTDPQVRITGHYPPGPAGNELGSQSQGCDAIQQLNYSLESYYWVDVSYLLNLSSRVVSFNFTVDPQIALDDLTKSKNLTFGFRSYIVLNGSRFVRNPADPLLGGNPDSTLDSGCNSPQYTKRIQVRSPSTTCNGFACVTLTYSQGENSGTTGFNASSLSFLNENESEYVPLFLSYKVDLFRQPSYWFYLNLSAPQANLLATAARTPVRQGECDFGVGYPTPALNASVAFNLSGLSSCTNYAPPSPSRPLSFQGVITSKPLSPAGRADLSLSLSDMQNSTVHNSWFSVSGNAVRVNSFAVLEANVSQDWNQYLGPEPYQAKAINCTAQEIASEACPYGYLNVKVLLTSLKNRSITFGVSVDPSVFNVSSATINGTTWAKGTGPVRQNGFTQTLALTAGQKVFATLRLVPTTVTSSTSINSNADVITPDGTLTLDLTKTVSVSIDGTGGGTNNTNNTNGTTLFPPGSDSCNGFIDVRYNPLLSPPLQIGRRCTDLAMMVSNVLPADAVPVNVTLPDLGAGTGQIRLRVMETDGSHQCYELCDVDADGTPSACRGLDKPLASTGPYLLRYYPESTSVSCPSRFKPFGNSIAGSSVKLEFGYSNSNDTRNVTVHVYNNTAAKALYISPVLTFYEARGFESGLFYPQLWTVANHKQIGQRKISLTNPSGVSLDFNGPGLKYFSYYPSGATDKLVVREVASSSTPLFDSSAQANPVEPSSEYLFYANQYLVDPDELGQQYLANITQTLRTRSMQNSYFKKEAFEQTVSQAKEYSKLLYWRDKPAVFYCQQTQACVSSAYGLEGCCKLSLEDWKNYTYTQPFKLENCRFCNNTINPDCNNQTAQHLSRYMACSYNSPNAYNCDQRCVSTGGILRSQPQLADTTRILGIGDYMTYTYIPPEEHLGIRYGQYFNSTQCVFKYSSPNAFVKYSSAQAASFYFYADNGFYPYNPQKPLSSITPIEVTRCTGQPSCPLLLDASNRPMCVKDNNDDGYYDPASGDFNLRPATAGGTFACEPDNIIAVNATKYDPAMAAYAPQQPRRYVTQAEVDYCRQGQCPLALGPDEAGQVVPWCFTDANSNGLLDLDNQAEADSVEPSVKYATPFTRSRTWNVRYCNAPQAIAVLPYCLSSCDIQCSAPNCDPACRPDGTKLAKDGQPIRTFQNWLNNTRVVEQTITPMKIKPLAPLSYFTELTPNNQPTFSHSFTVDTRFQTETLTQVALDGIDGCNPGSSNPEERDSEFSNQGLYTINTQYDPVADAWRTLAKVATIPAPGASATLYAAQAAGDRCKKTRETSLCALAFNDYSTVYGACFNSILQYDAGTKKPGTSQLHFLPPMGYGTKSGVGYGVTKSGTAFALLGHAHWQTTEGKYLCDYWTQDFEAWKPTGESAGTKHFEWKVCRKKKGGEGMLILGLALAVLTGGFSLATMGSFLIGAIVSGGFNNDSGDANIATATGGSTYNSVSPGMGGGCLKWDPVPAPAGDAFVAGCKNEAWQIIKR